MGFSSGSVVKNPPANTADTGSILEKIPWRRKWRLPGKPPWTQEPGGLHTVHGVAESDVT